MYVLMYVGTYLGAEDGCIYIKGTTTTQRKLHVVYLETSHPFQTFGSSSLPTHRICSITGTTRLLFLSFFLIVFSFAWAERDSSDRIIGPAGWLPCVTCNGKPLTWWLDTTTGCALVPRRPLRLRGSPRKQTRETQEKVVFSTLLLQPPHVARWLPSRMSTFWYVSLPQSFYLLN